MSAETLTIVLSAVGLLLTLATIMFAGFAWCIRRIDGVERSLAARIDGGDDKLGARIDSIRSDLVDVERSLGARIDGVAADVIELKVAVARLEGPQRHLIVASR